MRDLILIIHNVRSCYNVGSLLRTSDGLNVTEVILSGYTPYPKIKNDSRLPHLADKIDKQISKTALGAEKSLKWHKLPEEYPLTRYMADRLAAKGYIIAALEQTKKSVSLPDYQPPKRLAIIVGREVEGIEPEIMAACDVALEIPMLGSKESFNVASAAAMALYHCRYK